MSFPAYPAYKDSGVEWLGEVPEHWEVTKLSYVTNRIGSGKTPSGGAATYASSGVPFIRSQNVHDQGLRLDDIVYIDEETDREMAWSRVRPLDVLINITGASIGRSCQISAEFGRANVNQHVCVIRLDKAAEASDWVAWFMKSPSSKEQVQVSQTGAAREGLNFEQLAGFYLCMPPLNERKVITAFLDHETARIDALIEEQQRLIELLKEKRQAVISHAVTKGLDPTVPMKDSGVEWLGEVPAHWVRKRLKNISPFITVGIVVNPSDYVADEGLPFLYGGEVKEGFIEVDKARKISPEHSRKNRKTMLEAGDIVTMRVGYPGLTAVVPPECAGGNCASVMLVKRGQYDSRWLCAVMNSRLVRQQVEVVQYGAAQKQFNIADAIEFWMFEPPIEEQSKIAEFIDGQSSVFNALMEESEKSMLLLKERRSALVSAAVTGKIDVRGWQPSASPQAPKLVVAEVV